MMQSNLKELAVQWPNYKPGALRVEDAIALLTQMVQPMAKSVANIEDVDLNDCLERVLAHDVISPINVPPHDNAAMDGYVFHYKALKSEPTSVNNVELKVVGAVLAGQVWSGEVGVGECLKIMTGAALPSGVDTVVPHEQVRYADTPVPTITLNSQRVRQGDHCRRMGEDLAAGATALQQGAILTPAAIGLAASIGLARLPVMRRLRVAYFSTGDEILSSGDAPRAGAVYDSNRFTMLGMLKRLGCTTIDMGAVPDNPNLLQPAFVQGAACADVVITTGGVSTGDADFTHAMLQSLGEVIYWKLAMRPGRPMAVGRIGNAMLLGLPGNPVAAMVSFLVLVMPALLRMMGASVEPLPKLQARTLERIPKKPGRTEFVRAIVSNATDGSLQVKTTGEQGSGMLSSMVHANSLIVLPFEQGDVSVGDLVEVRMLQGYL